MAVWARHNIELQNHARLTAVYMSQSFLCMFIYTSSDKRVDCRFLCTQEELEESHRQYMQENPGLKAILADFLQALLIQKPDNVYEFARDFFSPFSPAIPPKPSFPSHRADS